LDITPIIFLPDEIKSNETHHYDYVKIKKFTDGILTKIKKEIGYNN